MIPQDHELISVQRQHLVGSAFNITEFDFEDIRSQRHDDRSDLASSKAVLGKVLRQGHNIKELDRGVHW